MSDARFEIFLGGTPGLEDTLRDEALSLGFSGAQSVPGGVVFEGGWEDVARANFWLRGATRVLARIASFRAMHPAQLDKRSRRVDWASVLRPDVAVRVEATTKQSRVYHAGAARDRVARAISETLGAPVDKEAALTIRVRIEDDLCTISVDTSGASLHQRGHKQGVGKAPIRETLAALFLRQCGYDGTEPLLDPMCGSGTFPVEAAEIAAGLAPGRSRGFAFQDLAPFAGFSPPPLPEPELKGAFFGFDRDQGAIAMARKNAERAGVAGQVSFGVQPIGALEPPAESGPGLIMVNPPYGGRIGKKDMLYGLYATLGQRARLFQGWRLGMVTSVDGLARATGLPFCNIGPPVPHGGLKVRLYQTAHLS